MKTTGADLLCKCRIVQQRTSADVIRDSTICSSVEVFSDDHLPGDDFAEVLANEATKQQAIPQPLTRLTDGCHEHEPWRHRSCTDDSESEVDDDGTSCEHKNHEHGQRSNPNDSDIWVFAPAALVPLDASQRLVVHETC